MGAALHPTALRPGPKATSPAVLGLTAGLCTGQGPLSRQSKGIPSSWRENHRKKLGLAHPAPSSSCIHTVPPHSLQGIRSWQVHPKEKSLWQISSSGSREEGGAVAPHTRYGVSSTATPAATPPSACSMALVRRR